jgi:cupin fold WbuC family metalloprotein
MIEIKNVFHHANDYADVGPEWIERLKTVALSSPLRRSRLCLHRSDEDALHEMIIALSRNCLFPPHRHPTKSESYHMIEGRFALIIFQDDGVPLRSFMLTPVGKGGVVCCRLNTPVFHAILPLDEIVIFQEVTNGPFKRGEAVLASWAPSGDPELREFLERAAIKCGIREDLLKKTNSMN